VTPQFLSHLESSITLIETSFTLQEVLFILQEGPFTMLRVRVSHMIVIYDCNMFIANAAGSNATLEYVASRAENLTQVLSPYLSRLT